MEKLELRDWQFSFSYCLCSNNYLYWTQVTKYRINAVFEFYWKVNSGSIILFVIHFISSIIVFSIMFKPLLSQSDNLCSFFFTNIIKYFSSNLWITQDSQTTSHVSLLKVDFLYCNLFILSCVWYQEVFNINLLYGIYILKDEKLIS